MKKRAVIFIVTSPFNYVYGLLENHFEFNMPFKAYNLEFAYEIKNAVEILLGREYTDYSSKVSKYEFKLKAKKAKVDIDIAELVKFLFISSYIKFDKKEKALNYYRPSDYGDEYLKITKLNTDEFKINYYDNNVWDYDKKLRTDYIFTKEQVIETIKTIKENHIK